jgi:hypothetical protein
MVHDTLLANMCDPTVPVMPRRTGRTIAAAFAIALAMLMLPRGTTAEELSREETIKQGQGAAKAGDFNKVYQLGLPLAVQGDADFQYGLSGVLLFYAEGMKIDGVADQDHLRLGMMWLHKAAEGGSDSALEELALFYRWGEKGLPRDPELSDCYTQAESDLKLVANCRARERAKGYDK